MPTAEYDLRYFQAGIDQLENYLLSDDLYWSVQTVQPSGTPPYPQLTPGGLLLARARLDASAQAPDLQARLNQHNLRFEQLVNNWRSAWGKKCRQDFRARLNLWTNFLNEYRDRPAANADRYAYEVQRRVQLQLLAPEARDLPTAELESLGGLDALLRALLVPGPFAWETALQPAFPESLFWYLYGGLRSDLPDAG
ncbi:MAG: hypothetical protein ACKOC5_18970 [Chloroflexota bacterium]